MTGDGYAVEREVRMRLVAPAGGTVLSIWRYRPTDPWAVQVEFLTRPASVVWAFSRELLARGVHGPAGLADVQIFPYRGAIAVGLHGDSGTVLMTARRADLARFLAATDECVAEGGEAEHVDLDVWLARVLEEAEQC